MNVALRKPWTQDEFLAWVVHQEGQYEFDGVKPVDMNGGTNSHGLIMHNLHAVLRAQLRGTPFRVLGPNNGVETSDGAVRYPDALVTAGKLIGSGLKVPDVLAVFEILSPSTMRVDRTRKVREYASVPTILRYVLIESTGVALSVLSRRDGFEPWQPNTTINRQDTIRMPEIGATIRVGDLYEDVDLEPGSGDEEAIS